LSEGTPVHDYLWALNKAWLVTIVAISLFVVSIEVRDTWASKIYFRELADTLGVTDQF
jgi:hypothetical protein